MMSWSTAADVVSDSSSPDGEAGESAITLTTSGVCSSSSMVVAPMSLDIVGDASSPDGNAGEYVNMCCAPALISLSYAI